MKKYLFIVLSIVLLCTGCFKRDSMEDITIYTSVYPIEYITTRLYGDNAEISSIYPNGIIVDKYTLTEKQLDDYSKADLFIFNGLSSEKDYIKPMFSKNKNLKIIDATSSIEYENKMEEIWLDPSNFLMIAQNIKLGFDEYITNQYLLNEIDTSNPELPSNEGCGVTLKENNVCEIYEGYGNTRIGIYTIENNKLVCNTIIRRGEEGPLSYTENDIIFEFNIINQDKLELNSIENNDKTAVSKDSALDKNGSNIYDSYGLTIGMTYSKSN